MRARRATAVGLLTVGLMLGTATAASAIPGLSDSSCDAPTPSAPAYGVMPSPQKVPTGDPFADKPTASVAEVYGLGGFSWSTCDLGPTDLGAASMTAIANFLLMFPRMFVSILDLVLVPAFHPEMWTHVFDGSVAAVSKVVQDMFWNPQGGASWASLALIVASIVMMVRFVHRGQIGKVMSSVVAIGAIGAAVAMIFGAPAKIGGLADGVIAPTLGGITSQLAKVSPQPGADLGQTAWGAAADAVLYRQWLQGEFGSDSSPTARKYGPRLFKDQAMSWSEKAAYDADPSGQGKKILEAKKSDWEDTTKEIKAKDPAAYAAITGKDVGSRLSAATAANFLAMTGLPMLTWSAFMVMLVYLVFRVLVMFGPIILLGALVPGSHGVATRMLRTALGCVINAVVFGAGAAVMMLSMSTLMAPSSGLPLPVAAIVNLMLGIAAWYALRPFRRISSVGGFANPAAAAASDAKHARRWVTKAATGYAAARWGARDGTRAAAKDTKPTPPVDTTSYRHGEMDPERVGYHIDTDTGFHRPELPGHPAVAAVGPAHHKLPTAEPQVTATARDLEDHEVSSGPRSATADLTPAPKVWRQPGTWVPTSVAEPEPLGQRQPRGEIPASPERPESAPRPARQPRPARPDQPAAPTVQTGEDFLEGYQQVGRVVDADGGEALIYTRKGGYHHDDIGSDATAAQTGGDEQ